MVGIHADADSFDIHERGTSLIQRRADNETEQTRSVAIDVFRGSVMAAMLFVDVCGDTVPVLGHSEWHGLKVADLVMPAFLFLMGSSMNLSFRNSSRRKTRSELLKSGFLRAVRLFFIGVIVQGPWIPTIDASKPYLGLDVDRFRIMGILQRIALCYILMMLITVYFRKAGNQVGWVCLCLLVQMSVIAFVTVPGCEDSASKYSMECNPEAYVDRLIFGREHLYKPSLGFDPEGVVSTLGCMLPCLIGYHTMTSPLRTLRSRITLATGLVLIGEVMVVLGCPLNKALWTPSFSFVTTGAVLAMYSAVDRENLWSDDNPLRHLGMNAILFFLLSDCCGILRVLIDSFFIQRQGARVTLLSWFLESVLRVDEYPSMILLYASLQLAMFLVLMSVLYHKQIFLRV